MAVPGGRGALGPHGHVAEWPPCGGQCLDRQRRPRAAGGRRQGGRALQVRRVSARECLHRRWEADPARQHRHGVQPARRARCARPARGGTPLPDRQCEDLQDRAQIQPGEGAEGLRCGGLQHGGAPDDAVTGREDGLLPALVLPRLRRDEPQDWEDQSADPVAQPDPEHPAPAVPARLCASRDRGQPGGHEDLRRGHHVRLRRGGQRQELEAQPADQGRPQALLGDRVVGRKALPDFWSGSDKVSKISYKTAKIVRSRKVGDHPQRVRNGFVRKAYVARLGVAVRDDPLAGAGLPPTVWERQGWPASES